LTNENTTPTKDEHEEVIVNETATPTGEPDTDVETPEQEGDVVAELEAKLEAAKSEIARNFDGWQRERAEFLNYKKRTEREKLDSYRLASADVIEALLPIIDDFERSLENIPDDLQDNPWVTGTAAIGRKFNNILENHDIEIVDPVGEPFDPEKHQAIAKENSDEYESGIVSTTLQKGYVQGDRVIRAALVKVAQ
jgi:molecular chaperone GrpE